MCNIIDCRRVLYLNQFYFSHASAANYAKNAVIHSQDELLEHKKSQISNPVILKEKVYYYIMLKIRFQLFQLHIITWVLNMNTYQI